MTAVGLLFGAISYLLIETKDYNALILVPSAITFAIGVLNITKLEAPRD